MASEDEEIIIAADFSDNVSRPARAAAEGIEELGEESKEAYRRLRLLQRQADKTGHSLELLAIKARAANMEFETEAHRAAYIADEFQKLDAGYKRLASSTKKVERNTKQANGTFNILRKTLKGFTRGLSTTLGVVTKLSLAVGVAGLVGHLGVLLQGLLSVAGALIPLASSIALVPTAVGALIASVLALKVAGKGLGEAFGAALSGDTNKLNEAIKGLSPSAKAAVKEFAGFSDVFKEIRKDTQEAFIKPWATDIKRTLLAVLPTVHVSLVELAREFGNVVDTVLEFMRTVSGSNLIKNYFAAALDMVTNFDRSLKTILPGLSDISTTVLPYWESLAQAVGDTMTEFGSWMSEISKSGQLKEWLTQASQTAKILWSVLDDVWGILSAVVKAAGSAGLDGLSSTLGEISKLLNSPVGQDSLQQVFTTLGDIARAVSPLLAIVANTIGTVLAPAISDIVTALAPGLAAVLQALSDALAQLGPYWGPLATALSDFLIALAPLLPTLAPLIVALMKLLPDALNAVIPLVDLLATGVLPVFVTALSSILPVLTPVFAALGWLSSWLNDNRGVLIGFAAVVAAVLVPSFIAWAISATSAAVATIAATWPILAIIAVVALLVVGIYMLVKHWDTVWGWIKTAAQAIADWFTGPFLDFFKTIGSWFADTFIGSLRTTWNVIKEVFETAATAVKKAWDFASDFFDGIKEAIKTAFSTVFNIITEPFKDAYKTIKGVIEDIERAIKDFNPGKLVGKAVDALNPFRFAGGSVDAGQKYIVGEIGPELYVPSSGTPELIGVAGAETRSFPSSGYIIPNNIVESLDRAIAGIEYNDRGFDSEDLKLAAGKLSGNETHNHYHEGNEYSITINASSTSTESELKRIVKKAVNEIEHERAERR